jgi:hypothetical protein
VNLVVGCGRIAKNQIARKEIVPLEGCCVPWNWLCSEWTKMVKFEWERSRSNAMGGWMDEVAGFASALAANWNASGRNESSVEYGMRKFGFCLAWNCPVVTFWYYFFELHHVWSLCMNWSMNYVSNNQ